MTSFYHITKGEEELDINDDAYKQYMDFKFVQVTVMNGKKVFQEFEAVKCTLKHFKMTENKHEDPHNFYGYW